MTISKLKIQLQVISRRETCAGVRVPTPHRALSALAPAIYFLLTQLGASWLAIMYYYNNKKTK